MARPIITSPRMLRTGQPLTLDQIRGVAPAVFALEPHSSRGPRYAYVPTIRPLQTLLDAGWQVWECAQQRSRAADRDPYTKHMLRLRHPERFGGGKPSQHIVHQGVPEVIIVNGHDGSAAYRLTAGFFRYVCTNGLMVGSTLGSLVVRHTIGPQTSDEVLLAGEQTITEKFPAMMQNIEAMQAKKLTDELMMRLANKAVTLRYGETVAPFEARQLLDVRRPEDKGDDAWTVLNRIQENIMNGGWETRSAMFARKSMVRPVERVSAVTKINGGLWDEALQLLEA